MAIFALLATIHVVRTLVEVWFGAAFAVKMRTWLTENVTDDWLADRAFYRNRFVPIEDSGGELSPPAWTTPTSASRPTSPRW